MVSGDLDANGVGGKTSSYSQEAYTSLDSLPGQGADNLVCLRPAEDLAYFAIHNYLETQGIGE